MVMILIPEHRQIVLGQCYIEHINNHDAKAAAAMLSPQAVYVSAGVGMHCGRQAIEIMMAAFFADVPDLHGVCTNWRLAAAMAVSFDFHVSGRNAATGARFDRKGVEWLFFDRNTLIRRVEVHG